MPLPLGFVVIGGGGGASAGGIAGGLAELRKPFRRELTGPGVTGLLCQWC